MNMLRFFATMVFAMGMGVATALAAGLDNSAWHMKEKTKTDSLVFVNGQLTSAECIPYGFVTGPYSATTEGNTIRWTAVQTNADGEKMTWKGEATGKTMKGSYTYTDKAGKASTTEWTAEKAERK
jgi:hypothetical protein